MLAKMAKIDSTAEEDNQASAWIWKLYNFISISLFSYLENIQLLTEATQALIHSNFIKNPPTQ